MYTTRDPRPGSRPDSTRARTYDALKSSLLRGDFGLGERLGEDRLAAELGVSRTPVREALSRLLSEGFVERHPDGGTTPTVPDLQTVRELYEVRFALERWAVRHPSPPDRRHDPELLAVLREDWAALTWPEADDDADAGFVLLDEDFHERLATAAGNRSLADQLQSINERIRLVRVHDFLSAERIERTIAQHLGVLDALIDDDMVVAEARLIAHFDESLAVVEERAALAIARMVQRWRR